MRFPGILAIAFGVLIVVFRGRVAPFYVAGRQTGPPWLRDRYRGVRGEERLRSESIAAVTAIGIGFVVIGVATLLGL